MSIYEQHMGRKHCYNYQRLLPESLEEDFQGRICRICVCFICNIQFARRCLANCHGLIIVSFYQFQTRIREVFMKKNVSMLAGRYANLRGKSIVLFLKDCFYPKVMRIKKLSWSWHRRELSIRNRKM